MNAIENKLIESIVYGEKIDYDIIKKSNVNIALEQYLLEINDIDIPFSICIKNSINFEKKTNH